MSSAGRTYPVPRGEPSAVTAPSWEAGGCSEPRGQDSRRPMGREVEERTLTFTSTPGSCSCSCILWSLQDLWIHTLAVNSLLAPMLPSLRRLNRFPVRVCSCKHFQPPQFRFTFQTIGGATAASEHFSYLQPTYLQYL